MIKLFQDNNPPFLFSILNEKNIYSIDCNQGILLYFENRLVRRYENNTLGNLDFLSDNSKAFGDKLKSGQSLFNNNGYISLKSYFKPNLFKTVRNNYYLVFCLGGINFLIVIIFEGKIEILD